MAFLTAQGIVDQAVAEKLVGTFGRMPLSLKLVGSLAARTPGGAAALLAPALVGGSLVVASGELIQGQLYERILDRISDAQLRHLAHPGLVLRRINPSLILDVLNEPCGLGIQTVAEARRLFEELQRETSLVSVDSSDGDLVHRADLRRVMLKLLLASAPAQVEQIRRAAAAWYERQHGRRAQAEEIYHRLHLGEWIDDKRLMDREVRASVQAAVEEFPMNVQIRLATLGFDIPSDVLEHATREQHEASRASQIEELLPYWPSSERQAQTIFAAGPELIRGSPLFRTGARLAAQRGDDKRALELIERGLEGTVGRWAAPQTLSLLQERAWLYRSRSRAEQADGLAALGEHARRHQDRPALLQHRMQLISLGENAAEDDLVVLGDLLTQAEPLDVWGLMLALQPAVKFARQQRAVQLLAPLQSLVQAGASPFVFSVFPDPARQSVLEGLLITGLDAGTTQFAERFLRLCEVWPYRILFVAPPYGRRGEQLFESTS